MNDEMDYDYDVPDMNPSEDEAYFYHTLGDFESYVKDLGAKYVITEMSSDVRKLLEDAFKQC
jgi:hypothetical protein